MKILNLKNFLYAKKIDKPGKIIKVDSVLKYKKEEKGWVSRGGIKLHNALETFNVDIKNKVCLDIGCSTGGFTEVLLSREAKHIYSVDVGYGQFDWKLRNSKKVTLYERQNRKISCPALIRLSHSLLILASLGYSASRIIPILIVIN